MRSLFLFYAVHFSYRATFATCEVGIEVRHTPRHRTYTYTNIHVLCSIWTGAMIASSTRMFGCCPHPLTAYLFSSSSSFRYVYRNFWYVGSPQIHTNAAHITSLAVCVCVCSYIFINNSVQFGVVEIVNGKYLFVIRIKDTLNGKFKWHYSNRMNSYQWLFDILVLLFNFQLHILYTCPHNSSKSTADAIRLHSVQFLWCINIAFTWKPL